MLRLALLLAATCLPLLLGCGTAAHAEDAYVRGVAALEAGRADDAGAWFRLATERDPSLLEAHLNLAALELADDHPTAALQRLESLRTSDTSRDPRVRYLQAVALLRTDDTESALEVLRDLDDENFPEASFLLGQQAYLAGDHGEAEEFFRRYLILRPEGGFGDEVQSELLDLADAIANSLEADAVAPSPAETSGAGEPVAEPGPTAEPIASPVDPPATTSDPEPDPEPEPDESPEQTPTKDPAKTPAKASPKSTPKSTPKSDPEREQLTEEEKAWRDARFLEIVKTQYAEAIAAYRRYLQLAPLGEHATAAQEGIVRCEAALKKQAGA